MIIVIIIIHVQVLWRGFRSGGEMTRKLRGVFPWCGRPGSARSRSGGSTGSSPRRDCRACRSYSSAPSTPRSLSRSRSFSPAYSPSRHQKASRGGARGKGCFGGSSTGTVAVVVRPQVRKPLPDINPRALPIEWFPDTIPRNVTVRHVCRSPRRGCSDHRCHEKKKSVSSVIIKYIYITKVNCFQKAYQCICISIECISISKVFNAIVSVSPRLPVISKVINVYIALSNAIV